MVYGVLVSLRDQGGDGVKPNYRKHSPRIGAWLLAASIVGTIFSILLLK
jgi:hypothetical protein